jgi:hypothetical protein
MKRIGFISLLIFTLLTACGGGVSTSGGSTAQSGAVDTAARPAAEMSAAEPMPAGGNPVDTEQSNAAQETAAQQQRLVIRTANLELLVADVEAAEAQVRQLAEQRGGYVLNASASGEESRRRATITFRVPATQFDAAINALADLAEKVDSRDIQGQDVTDEFVDLESRKRNLEAVEARLLQFLTEARRVEDLLQINQQLAEVQGQIEQTEGRIRYLRESAAMSTITASLYMRAVVAVVPEPAWSPMSTARLAAQQLLAFGQAIANVVIVVAIWFPVWLPLVLLGLWLRRRDYRDRHSTPPPSPPAPTQP